MCSWQRWLLGTETGRKLPEQPRPVQRSFALSCYCTISTPFTFENYAELWSRPVYGYIPLKSLLIALAVTFITVMLA